MAGRDVLVLQSFLSCRVCSETFIDPVSLSCNHNVCSSCLKQFWEQTRNKNCPICERRSSKEFPHVNFGLKELADSFAGRQKSGSSETARGEKKVEVVCSKHQEEPKLFCKDEDRAECDEEELQKHSVSFLSSYKATQTRARVQCSVSDPQLVSGALIDVAKHLGNLSFKVWEKMKDKVHFSPVILDPNTAYHRLYLSDDMTSDQLRETQLGGGGGRSSSLVFRFG